jgi:hypothetical protein
MTKQIIFLGQTANDRTGDPLRVAFEKVNSNFDELYARTGDDIQIPALAGNNGKVLTTNGTTLSWQLISSDSVSSISDFGEGFSLTAANKIVTNKLYSTNLTQPTQHYRLELDTNGVIILPDQSIINGSYMRAIHGSYAGLAAGPDLAHNEDSWMWVDGSGAWIATDYSDNAYTWAFGNDGKLTLPGGVTQQDTGSINCQINVDTVVFTSSQAGVQTIKLLLQVEGAQGSGQTHTHSCEMVVAKGFNGPTVAASVYGLVYTSAEPLATFTANWNPTLLRIEVTCRPTSLLTSVDVKAFATEITTSD